MRARSLLDPTFKYVNSVNTNIRETFARARAEIAATKEAEAGGAAKLLKPQFPSPNQGASGGARK